MGEPRGGLVRPVKSLVRHVRAWMRATVVFALACRFGPLVFRLSACCVCFSFCSGFFRWRGFSVVVSSGSVASVLMPRFTPIVSSFGVFLVTEVSSRLAVKGACQRPACCVMVMRGTRPSPALLAAFSVQCTLPVFGGRNCFRVAVNRAKPAGRVREPGCRLVLGLGLWVPGLVVLPVALSAFRLVRRALRQGFRPVTVGFFGVLGLPRLAIVAGG